MRFSSYSVRGFVGKLLTLVLVALACSNAPAFAQSQTEYNKHFVESEKLIKNKEYQKALDEAYQAYYLINNAKAIHRIGVIYRRLDDNQNSILWLKRAIDLEPTNFVYYYSLGLTYTKMKDYPTAFNLLEKSKELKPDDELAYVRIASIYQEQKEFDKALEVLNLSLKKVKKPFRTYCSIGRVYNDKVYNDENSHLADEYLSKAIKAIDKALEIEPNSAEAYQLKAWTYLNESTEAHKGAQYIKSYSLLNKSKKYYLISLKLEPDNVDAYFCLGTIYALKFNFVQAQKYFEKALELEPDAKDINEAIDKTKAINKKFQVLNFLTNGNLPLMLVWLFLPPIFFFIYINVNQFIRNKKKLTQNSEVD